MTKTSDCSPIFVVGCPRSGTNLMRYCLSRHSRIYIGPETNFFMTVYGNHRLVPEWRLNHCIKPLLRRMFACSADPSIIEFSNAIEKIISKNDCNSYKSLATELLSHVAKQNGKKRWGEKTPYHAFFIKDILKLFPQARVINMTRNPMAIAASYLKCGHMPASIYKAIADYRSNVKAASHYSELILNVEYESLVKNPDYIMRNVCNFIGEDFEEKMLNPRMCDSAYSEAMMDFGKEINIERQSLDKWKDVLSEREMYIVDIFTSGKFNINVLMEIRSWIRIKRLEWGFMARMKMAHDGFEAIRVPKIWLF